MSIKISSRKAKARLLQNFIRDTFRVIFKDRLEPEDIESRQMGGAGVDVIFSPASKKLIPFDIECKAQEKLQVHAALRQASENATPERIPLLIFKRSHEKIYVALEYDHFMKLIYNADIPQIKQILMEESEKSKKETILIDQSTGQ